MPAESKSQKRLMCMALAVKEGKLSPGKIPEHYRGKITSAAKSMSVEQLNDYCKGG